MKVCRHAWTALWTALALSAAALPTSRPGGALPGVLRPDAWRAVEEATPAARAAAGGGVEFRCPFRSANVDRFYWDHAQTLSLPPGAVLELDLTVEQPEAFRSLSVYLESGDGWYVAAPRLPRAGRFRISLAPASFSAEGRPAGWDRIKRIRLSAWRGQSTDAGFTLHALAVQTPLVRIVRGTRSTPAEERRIADGAAGRWVEWLSRMDVPHGVLTEEEVEAGALAGARVAVLPYNSMLPDATRRAMEAFLARGGKLIVCYSADPRLASRMGMKLGQWIKAEQPLAWCSFSFEQPGEWHVPARIYQQSGNLFPVHPASAGARVAAWWEDAAGRRTRQPAWVASPQGLWMSHILLADDSAAKPHLAAALVARYAPELWPRIAASAREQAGRVDSFAGFDDAIRAIAAAAGDGPAGEPVRALVARARTERARVDAEIARRAYGEALDASRAVRAALTEAYAVVQRPAAGEFRGVWDHDGMGWFPGDWDRTARLLAESGMTAILPNLAWGGLAHYPSRVLPGSYSLRTHGDQAAQVVRAAKRHGLETHIWLVCAGVGEASKEYLDRLRREGRLAQGPDGKPGAWLNLAHPANQDQIIETIRELARAYDIDGIHLDYIRYPGSQYDCSPWTRAAFERSLGRSVARWPQDVLNTGPLADDFQRWRTAQITALVRRARAELRRIRPGTKLSAAVFSEYPDCVRSVGQDWAAWLREDLVDFVTPMTYTENLAKFGATTARHLALPGVRGRIYPGIGVTANESRLMPDQVIEQVLAGRAAGARGFVLFSLTPELRDATLPILRMGVTKP